MLGLHHDTLETAGGGRGFHGLRQGSERIHARADRTNVEQSVAQQVKQPLVGVSPVHELANDPPVVSSAEPQRCDRRCLQAGAHRLGDHEQRWNLPGAGSCGRRLKGSAMGV